MKTLFGILLVWSIMFVSVLSAQTQVDNAKDLLKQGKTKEAIALLRQAVEASSKNIPAWQLLAQAYWKANNLDSAKIAAQHITSIDEKNVDGYLLVESICEAQKDIKGAHSTLIAGLAEKKGDPQLLTALGLLLLKADSVDRSVVVLTQAKEADPNSAVIYNGLGDAYYKQGVPAFAITQYEKSVELDSMKANVYDKLAKLYYKERRYNDAARAYARVVVLDPNNKDALLELSRMYLASRPKQYDNAAKYLKLYTDRFPKSDEAWAMYAEALFYLRQFPEALDAAQRVLKIDPKNGKALRYAATSQFVLKKYKEAVDTYKKLEAADTMKVDDYMREGDANVELKQTVAAVAAYEEVLKLDPNQKEVYNKAAAALMTEQKWGDAASLFERRFMTDTSARALSAYLNYASCKIALKEFDSARVAYHTFIAKRADYPPAWLGLARALLYVSSDSLQASRRAYEEWLKLIPPADEPKYKKEMAEANKYIGIAFLADKQYEKAIAPLKKSISIIDNDADVHFRLAVAYNFAGDKDNAIKEYQRTMKLDPKNKDAKKGLELLGIPVD